MNRKKKEIVTCLLIAAMIHNIIESVVYRSTDFEVKMSKTVLGKKVRKVKQILTFS